MQSVMPVQRQSISTVDNSLHRNFFSSKWKQNLALLDSLKNIFNKLTQYFQNGYGWLQPRRSHAEANTSGSELL